ncbi:MAG: 5-3-deoxyribonucleotidase [Microbacterium sp.]|jgi:5'-nucleotidase|nr:5-3-deoxyribonucleotidase [Microbacterium sp.]
MSGIRILVDLDGVLASWHGGVSERLETQGFDVSTLNHSLWDLGIDDAARDRIKSVHAQPGFYRHLQPIPGGIEVVRELARQGHQVRICSSPDSTNPTCASDKIAWVREHLGPEWVKRLILTDDKTVVRGDVLIDDKPLITGDENPEWKHIIFTQPYNAGVHDNRARLNEWTLQSTILAIHEAVVRG